MNKRYAIILAAGKGSRMKSKLYKVLHPVAGKPMVEHVLDQVETLETSKIVSVVGFGAEKVKEHLGARSEYVLQAEQLGTGHAVQMAESILGGEKGTTLVICGDTPLLTSETLAELFANHEAAGAKATILTAHTSEPTGYGRIIRNAAGEVVRIVEEKDASAEEKQVQEINTGTFCFDNQLLFEMLKQVNTENAQGEYYITDVIELLQKAGEKVAGFSMKVFAESLGVNDRVALAQASQYMYQRINHGHMVNGVTFVDPRTTYIDATVTIGADTTIEPNVSLRGKTVIGEDCVIGANSVICDSQIADGVVIRQSHLEQAQVGAQSDVGPFGRLRPQTVLGENVHIGNFVEVKNAQIGNQTKVGHLTYVGDATLGQNINVGCGTVFVNYDGKNKHQAVIGDGTFIGCNANLVAPVTVGANSFVAAGSTITDDVPDDSLAIARSRQINKENYAKKLPYSK